MYSLTRSILQIGRQVESMLVISIEVAKKALPVASCVGDTCQAESKKDCLYTFESQHAPKAKQEIVRVGIQYHGSPATQVEAKYIMSRHCGRKWLQHTAAHIIV